MYRISYLHASVTKRDSQLSSLRVLGGGADYIW